MQNEVGYLPAVMAIASASTRVTETQSSQSVHSSGLCEMPAFDGANRSALGDRVEMAAGSDGRGVWLCTLWYETSRDVPHRVDADVETGVPDSFEEILSCLSVRFGPGEHCPTVALFDIDRPELGSSGCPVRVALG